jgi:hypothetical protein
MAAGRNDIDKYLAQKVSTVDKEAERNLEHYEYVSEQSCTTSTRVGTSESTFF